MTTMLDRALALYELGFRVIPIGTMGDTPPKHLLDRASGDLDQAMRWWSKTPRIRWAQYQEEPITEALVEQWWGAQWPDANIAILTGVEVFVVDADSAAAVDWIESGNITVTPWRVRTGKGMHYYYRMVPGTVLKNSVNQITRIDTRGRGGYVIAPGSVHYSGTRYEWYFLPGWDCSLISDLPALTAEDLQSLTLYNGQGAGLALPEGALADLRTVSSGAHSGQAVSAGARNMAAASLAGQALQAGQSITETLGMLEQWNSGNQPPLANAEIAVVAASVANTHLRNHPGDAPLIAPAPLPGIPPPPPAPLIDPLTQQPIIMPSVYESTLKKLGGQVHRVSDLVARSAPVVEQFWGEDIFFRRARLMIVGEPKIGKSRFALNMAIAASIGGQFLGRTFVRPYRVTWMQAEIRYAYLRRRIDAVRDHLSPIQAELMGKNLVASERLSIDLTDDVDYAVMQAILDEHKPDILVIDPIIQFSSISENDAKEVSDLLKRIDALEETYNCAMVLVHHTTKIGKANGKRDVVTFENVRGSSAFVGWFDTGVLLTGTEKKTQVQWSAREASIPSTEIAWNGERGEYETAFDDVAPIQRVVQTSRGEARLNSLMFHAHQILVAAAGQFVSRAVLSAKLERLDPTVATGGALRDCFARLSASSGYELGTADGVQQWRLVPGPDPGTSQESTGLM